MLLLKHQVLLFTRNKIIAAHYFSQNTKTKEIIKKKYTVKKTTW